MSRLAPFFLRQGFVASSTEEPFEDYLVQGMGKSPMVMIYESQYVQRAAAADGSITPDMVLMYPDPTIFSKHTFVGLTPDGIRLGDFLTNDPEMRSLATEYGFRTTDTGAFAKFVADHKLAVPTSLIDIIDPPTYETLESMITRLEAQYSGQGLPTSAVERLTTQRQRVATNDQVQERHDDRTVPRTAGVLARGRGCPQARRPGRAAP